MVTAWPLRYSCPGAFSLGVGLLLFCSSWREGLFGFWRDPQRQLAWAPVLAAGAACAPQGTLPRGRVSQGLPRAGEPIRHRARRSLAGGAFGGGALPGEGIASLSGVGNNLSPDFAQPFWGGVGGCPPE